MPAESKLGVMARQWQILKFLPHAGSGMTARELTEKLVEAGHKVSKRQTERDLNELSKIFDIECNDKGIPHGWHWKANGITDLTGMTINDALSLRLVEDIVKPLIPVSMLSGLEGRFRQAEKLVGELENGNAAAKWARKVRVVLPTQPLLPAHIDSKILGDIQEALMKDFQIDADYHSASEDEPSSRRLHPLGIVNRGASTYLVAKHEDEKPRTYALHRFTNVKITYDPCRKPKGFSLDDYIARGEFGFGSGEEIILKAWVSNRLAKNLSETQLSEEQVLDGNKLTAKVRDTEQLIWWIQSQANAMKVLSPVRLKNRIKKAAQNTVGIYTTGS